MSRKWLVELLKPQIPSVNLKALVFYANFVVGSLNSESQNSIMDKLEQFRLGIKWSSLPILEFWSLT